MRSSLPLRIFVFAAALSVGASVTAAPRLIISLPKRAFVVGEPIKLDVDFRLGTGCWTLNPNVTSLTLRIVDGKGEEVPENPVEVMYRLPACNFAVFCRVKDLRTWIFLGGRGPDMYPSYYKLKPGRYRVQAVYDSGEIVAILRGDEDHYCWDKIFRKDLIKHLESNVVEFEVVAAEPGHEGSVSERAPCSGTEDGGKSTASPPHESAPRPDGDGGSRDNERGGG